MAAPPDYCGTSNGALSRVSTIVPRGILTLAPRVTIDAPVSTFVQVRAPELPSIRPPMAADLNEEFEHLVEPIIVAVHGDIGLWSNGVPGWVSTRLYRSAHCTDPVIASA